VPEGLRKLTKLNELWLKNNPLPRCVAGASSFTAKFISSTACSVPFRPARASHRPYYDNAVLKKAAANECHELKMV
jgi:hypothetical protein